MKQQSLFCIPHARFPRQSDIYFKTLFLSVPFGIDHRRFTAGIKLFHTGNVHAHLSPRLVAGLQAVPYTHCEKFFQFHQVSRSSPICSDSVLYHSQCTHPLIKRAHFSPTLYAGLFHPSLATSVRSVRRYTVCTKHGRSKLPFSVSLRISTVTIYYYIYIM